MAYANPEDKKAYANAHYLANTDYYKQKARAKDKDVKLRNRQIILTHLLDNPCVDCGEDDVIVLEFDHVRGEKLFPVSRSIGRKISEKKLRDEIDKCEVRCANCHRRKTYKQFERSGRDILILTDISVTND